MKVFALFKEGHNSLDLVKSLPLSKSHWKEKSDHDDFSRGCDEEKHRTQASDADPVSFVSILDNGVNESSDPDS